MKSILIIGAGAMGAAFSVPCIDNKHKVTLSEPYDFKLIKKINSNRKFHPYLKIKLNGSDNVTLCLLSMQGTEKAAPMAPAPIINILFIFKIMLKFF